MSIRSSTPRSRRRHTSSTGCSSCIAGGTAYKSISEIGYIDWSGVFIAGEGVVRVVIVHVEEYGCYVEMRIGREGDVGR